MNFFVLSVSLRRCWAQTSVLFFCCPKGYLEMVNNDTDWATGWKDEGAFCRFGEYLFFFFLKQGDSYDSSEEWSWMRGVLQKEFSDFSVNSVDLTLPVLIRNEHHFSFVNHNSHTEETTCSIVFRSCRFWLLYSNRLKDSLRINSGGSDSLENRKKKKNPVVEASWGLARYNVYCCFFPVSTNIFLQPSWFHRSFNWTD